MLYAIVAYKPHLLDHPSERVSFMDDIECVNFWYKIFLIRVIIYNRYQKFERLASTYKSVGSAENILIAIGLIFYT